MSTIQSTSLSPELQAALDEAIRHATTGGGDPKILKWIREEAKRIREDILNQHGVLDIGVPAIRELRGDLPES